MSAGCNGLLAEGAHACRGVDDILEMLPTRIARDARKQLAARAYSLPAPLGRTETDVLDACQILGGGPLEQLQDRTGLGTPILLRAVMALELRGLVRVIGGGRIEPVVSTRRAPRQGAFDIDCE